MVLRFSLFFVAASVLAAALPSAGNGQQETAVSAPATRAQPLMEIQFEQGLVVIQLRADKAPMSVAHLRELVARHFYDGLSVVRIEPGHVIQAGDPNFDGTGGSGRTVPLEASDLRHTRGAVGLARGEDVNSADSQFYVCLADRPQLDGRYTVIGYVVRGMEVIDRMAAHPGDGPRGFITERRQQPRIVNVRFAPPQSR